MMKLLLWNVTDFKERFEPERNLFQDVLDAKIHPISVHGLQSITITNRHV